ncbi:MAG: helix-turn-helix domain-containing protein [Bacteroidia bacterium]|nr:helix-turn-helix domain-containing protein [Bacteroidia bacterium]
MGHKEKTFISSNLRFLRKEKNMTQEELAQELNIGRHSVGSYEEGRAEPKIDTMMAICRLFEIPVPAFVEKQLSEVSKDELEMIRGEYKADIEGKNLRVLPVMVNEDGEERITVVPQKAAAGYLNGYGDPEYIENLPTFNLPLPELDTKYGTYRTFQVSGDSMLPIKPGSYIIAQYLENFKDIKDDEVYVIVSNTEGVVLKRTKNRINKDGSGTVLLKSDNPAYSSYEVKVEDIKEVWKAKAYISLDFPDPEITLERISTIVMELQHEVIKLKNK